MNTPSPATVRPLLRQAALLAMGVRGYHRHYIHWKLKLDPAYTLLMMETRPWGKLLDAGCGQAIVALLAAVRGDTCQYLGVDGDRRKLAVANRLCQHLPVPSTQSWQVQARQLPDDTLPAGPFDTIMLLDVLHYWPRETQAIMLAQLRARLSPQGRLYLREGFASSTGRTGLVGWGETFTTLFGINPRVGKLYFQTQMQMRDMLANARFAVERTHPAGGVNALWVCAPKQD